MSSPSQRHKKIVEEFRKKFTQESPRPEYREIKHEYYLDCTEVEQFLLDSLAKMEREAQRKLAQKAYDKWNNEEDSSISFGEWLRTYLLIKSREK